MDGVILLGAAIIGLLVAILLGAGLLALINDRDDAVDFLKRMSIYVIGGGIIAGPILGAVWVAAKLFGIDIE